MTDLCHIPQCWHRWTWRVTCKSMRTGITEWTMCVCDEHVVKWRSRNLMLWRHIVIEAR